MLSKKTLTIVSFLIFFFSNTLELFTQLNQIFLFNQQLIEQLKHLVEILQKKKELNKLKEIASDTVDIKGIGFYTLGAYRKNITE